MSAESIREEHPKTDADSLMHGGIPKGKDYYHVNVSLSDAKTTAVITDAQVEARVADSDGRGETKKLEIMGFNNTISYGNYFRIPRNASYAVTVQVRKPDASRASQARFDLNYR